MGKTEKTPEKKKSDKKVSMSSMIGMGKNQIIDLINSWLPEPAKKMEVKFMGDMMYCKIDGKELRPQKLNVAYKFILTKKIIDLTGERDYAFIECIIDFENKKMTGKEYFIKDGKKLFKSFEL